MAWSRGSSHSGLFFFFNDTATTEIYTLSLHDALPICPPRHGMGGRAVLSQQLPLFLFRSEEHTSELQSPKDLVCRLLLEKKKGSAQAGRREKTRCRARVKVEGKCFI